MITGTVQKIWKELHKIPHTSSWYLTMMLGNERSIWTVIHNSADKMDGTNVEIQLFNVLHFTTSSNVIEILLIARIFVRTQ